MAGDLQESEIWDFAHFLACHFSLALLHITIDLLHIVREFSDCCSVKLHKMKFHFQDRNGTAFGFLHQASICSWFVRWKCAFNATEALDSLAKCSFVPGSKSLKLFLALKAYSVEQGGKELLPEHKEPALLLMQPFSLSCFLAVVFMYVPPVSQKSLQTEYISY